MGGAPQAPQPGGQPMSMGGGQPDMQAMMQQMQGATEEEEQDPETGNAPDAAPTATKLPDDMSAEEKGESDDEEEHKDEDPIDSSQIVRNHNPFSNEKTEQVEEHTPNRKIGSVGVICLKDGAILSAIRKEGAGKNLIGGPGGHVEWGETPRDAAIRETEEEFGIRPKDLVLIGYGEDQEDDGFKPAIFLCTEWDGEPRLGDGEMGEPMWLYPQFIEDMKPALFKPFADGVRILNRAVDTLSGERQPNAYYDPKETVALSEEPYNPKIDYEYPNSKPKDALGKLREFILSFRKENKASDFSKEHDIMQSRDDEFVESDHPRDNEGMFTEKGNGESGASGDAERKAAKQELRARLEKALKPKPNKAIFFSGCNLYDDDGNLVKNAAAVANEFAHQNDGDTMNTLLSSNKAELPEWDFDDEDSIRSWEEASELYAKQASGDVRVIVGDKLREGNIFEAIELPILMENKAVTSITTINPRTGEKKTLLRRE